MRQAYWATLGVAVILSHFAMGKAYGRYGMAGCGFGSLVISPGGPQLLAATTNGTSGSQLFGITSGTANCETRADMAVIAEQEWFLAANLNTLQKEMAQGYGETLTAFTDLLGCPEEVQEDANKTLVKRYSAIFGAPGIHGVLETSKAELRSHDVLKSQCKIVG